jgi:hypothetical protein
MQRFRLRLFSLVAQSKRKHPHGFRISVTLLQSHRFSQHCLGLHMLPQLIVRMANGLAHFSLHFRLIFQVSADTVGGVVQHLPQ